MARGNENSSELVPNFVQRCREVARAKLTNAKPNKSVAATPEQLLTAGHFDQAVHLTLDIGKNPVSDFSISKNLTIFEKIVTFFLQLRTLMSGKMPRFFPDSKIISRGILCLRSGKRFSGWTV